MEIENKIFGCVHIDDILDGILRNDPLVDKTIVEIKHSDEQEPLYQCGNCAEEAFPVIKEKRMKCTGWDHEEEQ